MLQKLLAETAVFHTAGSGACGMAREMGVPFLGRIPMDPALSKAAEEGRSVAAEASSSSSALQGIIWQLLAACGEEKASSTAQKDSSLPGQNGHSRTGTAQPSGVEIDPLLSSRIHLGF